MRVHYDPAALPQLGDEPGTNRFDDPRPRSSQDRYVMRYAATNLRGCLLELLDWLRTTDSDATEREAAVINNDASAPTPPAEPWQALQDYLTGRHVGVLTGPDLQLVSIDDSALQAELDREPGVRALLDSELARAALLPAGAAAPRRRAHLDGAAVRLSTDRGRDLTRAASLALRDRPSPPDGIHYRSRHDDAEDCWALYDHAQVIVDDIQPLSPEVPGHRLAVQDVASLWDLPLPPAWADAKRSSGRAVAPG